MASPREETKRGRTDMNDQPQTFIAYNWAQFHLRRGALYGRVDTIHYTVAVKVGTLTNATFGFGARIFPGTGFPGGLFGRIPSK